MLVVSLFLFQQCPFREKWVSKRRWNGNAFSPEYLSPIRKESWLTCWRPPAPSLGDNVSILWSQTNAPSYEPKDKKVETVTREWGLINWDGKGIRLSGQCESNGLFQIPPYKHNSFLSLRVEGVVKRLVLRINKANSHPEQGTESTHLLTTPSYE